MTCNNKRMKHPRWLLEAALTKIVERWNLSWINAADYKKLGVIEGCAHELAHALDLGPDFEVSLRAMTADETNSHEATTLRIEVASLVRLGVHLAMRRLLGYANWDDAKIPSRAEMRVPLNPHEQRCVERFVTMVTQEVEGMTRGAGASLNGPSNTQEQS